jgi:Icc-related predicted phosphoesterase
MNLNNSISTTKKSIKILHISDTHTLHGFIKVPEVDMVIHSGDATNYREYVYNSVEFLNFLEWYKNLDIKYKILVAGNHDGSLMQKIHKDELKEASIIYLENTTIEIDGLKIFGSPMTPIFGNWYFMADRSKMYKYWDQIDYGTDIVITHGPPHGILDLGERATNLYELTGCKNLLKTITMINPQIHQFGHLHNHNNVINNGIYKGNFCDTSFMNASCVTDENMDKLSSNGYISIWENNKLKEIKIN